MFSCSPKLEIREVIIPNAHTPRQAKQRLKPDGKPFQTAKMRSFINNSHDFIQVLTLFLPQAFICGIADAQHQPDPL